MKVKMSTPFFTNQKKEEQNTKGLKGKKKKATKTQRKGERVKKAEGKGIYNGKGLSQKANKTFFKTK